MEWYIKVLRQYADFKGRARRKEYWMFVLFNAIINYGIMLIAYGTGIYEINYVQTVYSWAVLVPSIAVGVRRMHDVGKSGWYLLIPIYNLVLAVTDSQPGDNEWGENPKGIGNTSVIDQIGKE